MADKSDKKQSKPNVFRTPSIQVALVTTWRVAPENPALTPEQIARLVPYVTRYAQTLGVGVYAVGGFANHLHVFYDLPPTKSIREVEKELQKASIRYLRDSLGAAGLEWGDSVTVGVSPENVPEVSQYIAENTTRHQTGQIVSDWEGAFDDEPGDTDEELPDWLRQALDKSGE